MSWKYELKPIPAGRVRYIWDAVKPRLEDVLEKTRHNERWRPEDVYAALKMEQAALWVAFDEDGSIVTVAILKVQEDFGEDYLRVWIACNLIKGFTIIDYHPQLAAIAKKVGCKRIVWDSPRKGYARALAGKKARLVSYRFEMEV